MKIGKYAKNAAIVGIGVYIAVLLVFYCFYKTDINWLSFLGSYIGSFIGATATFTAFYFTYRANENMYEQQRLQSMPLFDYEDKDLGASKAYMAIYVTENGITSKEIVNCNHNEMIKITNVGKSVAINTTISQDEEYRIGHIQQGECRIIQFLLPLVTDKKKINPIRLNFTSFDGVRYYQELTFVSDGIRYNKSISEIKN